MEHLILTRFGVGQARDGFFRANLPFLQETLAPSLRAQTDRRFKWVVIVDTAVPNWVEIELALVAGIVPEMVVKKHNPVKERSFLPDFSSLLLEMGVRPGSLVATTRVDADDGLSSDFNHNARRLLRENGNLVERLGRLVVIFPVGVALYANSGIALRMHKKNYSVVSCLSRLDSDFSHAYSAPHTSWALENHPWIIEMPEQTGPSWLRVMRPGSVHKSSGVPMYSRVIDRLPQVRIWISCLRKIIGRRTANVYEKTFSSENVAKTFSIDVKRLRTISNAVVVQDSNEIPSQILEKYVGDQRVTCSQLWIKEEILRQLGELTMSSGSDDKGRIKLEQDVLTTDFYSF